MSLLKKGYRYLFYKIYRFFESNEFSAWWSEWKAALIINILFIFIMLSTFSYYKIYIDKYVNIYSVYYWFIILFIFINIYNYYLFIYKDKWKLIVKEFDKLPKKKNKIGSWLVFLFICSLFINLIYSFYLGSQIDWSQYR